MVNQSILNLSFINYSVFGIINMKFYIRTMLVGLIS